MEVLESKEKELVEFTINRKLIFLSKSFLVVLEDLLESGCRFDYNRKRKAILDQSNDAFREIQEVLNKFDISIKKP